jgi:SpoVK/Ycf46/Vps4 family AAA+-type ATPase
MVTKAKRRAAGSISAAKRRQLRTIARARAARSGVRALFVGPSGTGKTLAAENLARELGLDLHRVDLSGVVSKYIGETEKNLARVLDRAARSGAVLYFDEADALFGKRTGVKDSHDRYANLEVGYLLQRIERHDGVAILSTNSLRNIDAAFVRRVRHVLRFPQPVKRRQSGIRSPSRAVRSAKRS